MSSTTALTTTTNNPSTPTAANMVDTTSNAIATTLASSVSVTGKRKSSVEISDSASKKRYKMFLQKEAEIENLQKVARKYGLSQPFEDEYGKNIHNEEWDEYYVEYLEKYALAIQPALQTSLDTIRSEMMEILENITGFDVEWGLNAMGFNIDSTTCGQPDGRFYTQFGITGLSFSDNHLIDTRWTSLYEKYVYIQGEAERMNIDLVFG